MERGAKLLWACHSRSQELVLTVAGAWADGASGLSENGLAIIIPPGRVVQMQKACQKKQTHNKALRLALRDVAPPNAYQTCDTRGV
jgi:hypothetical protein